MPWDCCAHLKFVPVFANTLLASSNSRTLDLPSYHSKFTHESCRRVVPLALTEDARHCSFFEPCSSPAVVVSLSLFRAQQPRTDGTPEESVVPFSISDTSGKNAIPLLDLVMFFECPVGGGFQNLLLICTLSFCTILAPALFMLVSSRFFFSISPPCPGAALLLAPMF